MEKKRTLKTIFSTSKGEITHESYESCNRDEWLSSGRLFSLYRSEI
jgi:hypothetical protein